MRDKDEGNPDQEVGVVVLKKPRMLDAHVYSKLRNCEGSSEGHKWKQVSGACARCLLTWLQEQ